MWDIIASIGLGAAQSYGEGNLNYDQSRMSIKTIDKMLTNLQRQQEELRKAYETRGQIATDIYGNKVSDAYYRAGTSLKDVNRQYNVGTAQTGLAYSGTLYEAAREGKQGIRHELTSTKRDLENQFGQTMADLEISKSKDMATIENTIAQLKGQRDVFKEGMDEDSFLERLIDPLNTGMWEGWGTGKTMTDIFFQGGVGSLLSKIF